ncbi:MAG: proteasome subunit beta [Candidatus Brockarchaeota archaeon]|nr:proteasome subunit beta [Candidatus Brockarchaeota archaeon]
MSTDARFNPQPGDKRLWGTTTVAVECKDGVVLATDTRVVAGYYMVAHKHGKKVHKIDDHMAITISGGVADAQAIVDFLRVQARLHRMTRGFPLQVHSAASLVSNVLFNNRIAPLAVQLILAGLDRHGARIYQIDPFGGATRERFVSTGSGSPVAIGYLEAVVNGEMTVEKAIPLSIQAINVAMKRNTATGNDFDISTITEKGYTELSAVEKEAYLQSAGGR